MSIFEASQAEQVSNLFAECFNLTQQPVRYVYETDLAFCSREPCRGHALQLAVGQIVSLSYDPSSRRIATVADTGYPVGYLYAKDAAFLAILFDFIRSQSSGPGDSVLLDESHIRTLTTGPCPDRPETIRLRYPKVALGISLTLRHAWPLFTILTVLHLKDETLAACVALAQNPWLQPFNRLRQDYCRQPYDAYRLPDLLTTAWIDLTGTA